MIINHRKPSLNQGISRPSPSPSPSPFNSHILIVIVFIIYFVLLVLILSRQQISPPTKYNTPSHIQDTTFNWNTRYIRFLLLLRVLLLSDNIEKYHLFSYSTPTRRFQPSLSSYKLTPKHSLPLFLNLNAIRSVRLESFSDFWHLQRHQSGHHSTPWKRKW